MKSLCIIPCGSKKIWDTKPDAGPTKAKDVYTGNFSKKCREYAETFHSGFWCILSAKYGFLYPDDEVIGTYNVTFNIKTTSPISNEELVVQALKKGLHQYQKIIVLGGKNYTQRIRKIFSDREISTPLVGCRGMGYMMQKLNDAIKCKRQI